MPSFFEENRYAIVVVSAVILIILLAFLNDAFVLGVLVGVLGVFVYQYAAAPAVDGREKYF
jgi:hypothetical protein